MDGLVFHKWAFKLEMASDKILKPSFVFSSKTSVRVLLVCLDSLIPHSWAPTWLSSVVSQIFCALGQRHATTVEQHPWSASCFNKWSLAWISDSETCWCSFPCSSGCSEKWSSVRYLPVLYLNPNLMDTGVLIAFDRICQL